MRYQNPSLANFSNFGPGTFGGSVSPRPAGSQGIQPNFRGAQQAIDNARSQFSSMTQQGPRSFQPYTNSFTAQQPGRDYGRGSNVPGGRMGRSPLGYQAQMNDAAWGALFSNAVAGDMQTQQDIMNQQFNRLNQNMGQFENAFTQGASQMQDLAAQQRASLGAKADEAMKMGQQGYDEFKAFRDQQMGRVDQDIAAANQQAAGAVSSYEQTMAQYQDRTASQAQNMAVGLQRSVQNAMNDINTGMNPDGTMMDPAQKAAMLTTLQQNTAEQTRLGLDQINNQFNDTMATMGANLASLKQAQSQSTLAGGQLRGQVGAQFGAQTLDAQRLRASMQELSSTLTQSMEQMAAASQMASINLLTQGYNDMYNMIQGNKQGATSMYAALSGWLAGMTTPGLNQIAPPNFGNA